MFQAQKGGGRTQACLVSRSLVDHMKMYYELTTPSLKSHFATECAQSIIFVVQKSSGCADPKVTYFATNLAII